VIVCLSQGRSGTKYLSRVMSLYGSVACYHEPQPDFTQESLQTQTDQAIAKRFLVEKKLPALAEHREAKVYIETSHMWCAGLAEAWCELDVKPALDAVILDRPIHLIALSLYNLGITPGEDPWYLDPLAGSCLLKYSETGNWGRYHKCYAYCLEIEARKHALAKLLRGKGGRVTRISISEVPTWKGFFRIRRDLELPWPSWDQLYTFLFLKKQRLNTQEYVKSSVAAEVLDVRRISVFQGEVSKSLRNPELLQSASLS